MMVCQRDGGETVMVVWMRGKVVTTQGWLYSSGLVDATMHVGTCLTTPRHMFTLLAKKP